MKPTDEHLTDEDIFGVPGYDEDPEGREEMTDKELRCLEILLDAIRRDPPPPGPADGIGTNSFKV